jgi:hypothetical protein
MWPPVRHGTSIGFQSRLFNEKPLVPFCTYAVGSELGDVRHSKLPPSLCQEGPLNTLFYEIGDIPMKMES